MEPVIQPVFRPALSLLPGARPGDSYLYALLTEEGQPLLTEEAALVTVG